MFQKLALSSLFIFLQLSCTSTTYHKPIALTQSEIAKGRLVDGRPFSATKIHVCPNGEIGIGQENCTILICTRNKSTETGLECLAYVPESQPNNISSIVKTKPVTETKYSPAIQIAILSYQGNNKQPLTDLCSIENIVCYLNARFFPPSKINSSNLTAVEAKSRIELKSGGRTDILDITIYQD